MSAKAVTSGYDVAELRRLEFPWSGDTVYLNHASVGPLPERTRMVLDGFNRKRAAPFELPDRQLMMTLAESRRLAAALIGATPEEIALSINTGFGLSLAARALPLQAGDIVDVPTSGGKRLLRSLVGAIVPTVGQLPTRVIPIH